MSRTEQRADELAAAFARMTGRSPDGVWAAPGRVNLHGEHTDYNDGLVLPTAIDRETLAAVAVRDDGLVTCRSLNLPGTTSLRLEALAPGAVHGWPAYVIGVLWALREAGAPVPGLDVVVCSDVPNGAGLASSAALEAAVALAVSHLTGADLGRTELAVLCRRAETDVVGAPVGVMDQMASLCGEDGTALLLDCRSLQTRPVPLVLEELGLHLVVLDTRVSHAHAGGEYGARRRTCEQAAAALGIAALRDASLALVTERLTGELLRCARHVVTENARVEQVARSLEQRDVAALGELFAASHASMRDEFRISCPELDLAVDTALAAGAVAARMTGGGFGGSAVALVPSDRLAAVEHAVVDAFSARGWAGPNVFAVAPSAGGRRAA